MARRYGDDDSATPAPRNDVYTGLLAISFFAMLAGCLLLFLDYWSYPESKPAGLKVPAVAGAKTPVAVPKAKKEPVDKKVEEPKKVDEPKKDEAKKDEKDMKKDDKDMKKDEKDAKKDDAKKDDAKKDDKDKKE